MQALRAGVTVLSFWDLTPRETLIAMEAAVWRAEQAQAGQLAQAWHVAALLRNKQLPSLRTLLARLKPSKAKKLPIEERRREFESFKRSFEAIRIK